MAKRTDIQDGITLMLISRMKSTFYRTEEYDYDNQRGNGRNEYIQ